MYACLHMQRGALLLSLRLLGSVCALDRASAYVHMLTACIVMEYLGGGEIKWRTPNDNPLLRVDQTRRICRDVILGLEYRTFSTSWLSLVSHAERPRSTLPGHHSP